MAKKSSKKSMKFVLLDLLSLILAGGLIGFLALPYVKYQASALVSTYETTASGFKLLDFDGNTAIATVVLLIIIFASLLAVSAILKICCDAKVITNKTCGKAISLCLILFAFASLVMAVVAMIVVSSECSAGSLGFLGIGGGSKPSWLALILGLLVSLSALISSLLSVKK